MTTEKLEQVVREAMSKWFIGVVGAMQEALNEDGNAHWSFLDTIASLEADDFGNFDRVKNELRNIDFAVGEAIRKDNFKI